LSHCFNFLSVTCVVNRLCVIKVNVESSGLFYFIFVLVYF
jgi:hypothetical protein